MGLRILKAGLMVGTLLSGFSVTNAAWAQDTDTSAPDTDTIIVTGSRIARRDGSADSPILTIEQTEITESGHVTLDHYLNTLPQVTPSLSSQSNNPSSNGRAFIDLRGLGSGRNLILMDGRRPMGSLSSGTVDVNTIPAALVERVEIITGGAASTYGADAVSGVVNFVMRDDFDGLAIDSQYRLTEQGDGEEWGGDITLGADLDNGRGNAVFNLSYFHREAMYKDAREFAAQASGSTGTFPGGSYTTGANTPSAGAVAAIFGADACNTNGGQAGFGFNPNGSLFCTGVGGLPTRNVVGYTGPESDIATAFYPDFFSYNFEPANILVLPMNRWNFYTNLNYEVNEHFAPYVRAMYTNYNSLQELAPTPAGGSTGFTVPVTNPFIGPELAALLASRTDPNAPFAFAKRFNTLGGRTGYNTHDVWQVTGGAEGNIVGSWDYDVYASFGRSVQNEVQGGNVRRDRVQSLLDAADGGASVCAGGLNLFGSAAVSAECAAYISLEAKNLTVIEQNIVEATATGDLFELPAGTVQAAFGSSYRSLDFDFLPDGGLQPGLVAGFNQQLPVTGYLDYVDVFGEVLVPLVADAPFAENISLTLGFRRTDNNLAGTADSWKVNGDWTLNDQLRFRGGVQQAIRSPSIAELFSPQLNNFPNINGQDPCNTTGAIAATYRNGPNAAQVQALCNAQSPVAGGINFVQPAAQAAAISGGNPNLTPEESQSFTFGFVTNAPLGTSNSWLDSIYLSVDYWSIELENVIAAVGATTIIQRCFNRDNANPTFDINNEWCQLFDRNASNGSIENLLTTSRNQSFINTSGVDIVLGWSRDFDTLGTFGVNWVTTWVEKYETQTTSVDPVNNFSGTIGSGTGSSTPEWRSTLNTSWARDALAVQLTTRYIDAMDHSLTVTGGTAAGVPATWYNDIRVTYDLTESLTLRAGVNNLLDQEPRLYSPNVQANTDPSTYDVLGRRYFVGFNLRM